MNNPVVGIFGAILTVSAIFFGSIGYEKNQPTGVESFASGILTLGAALDSANRDQAEKDLQSMKSQQFNRALPFYGIAFLSGVAGIFLLAQYARGVITKRKS
jgi:hypothetical protein